MAGFCSYCGRPLPDDGRCPYCAPAAPNYSAVVQQPVQPAQPSAFSLALKNFGQFLRAYLKNPLGTTRIAVENHDFLTGFFVMAITVTISFILTFAFALRFRPDGGEFEALEWFTVGVFAPVIAYGFCLGCIYLTSLVGKMRIQFKSVLAATGCAGVIPTAFLAAALPISMVSLSCADFCWAVVLISAGIMTLLLLTRVFNIKCNLWQILIIIGVAVSAYYVLTELVNWLRTAVITYSGWVGDFYDFYSGIFG